MADRKLMPINPDLTPIKASEYLEERGVRGKPKTLQFWRREGKGPRSYTIGRHRYYPQAELDAWLEERRQKLTNCSWSEDGGESQC